MDGLPGVPDVVRARAAVPAEAGQGVATRARLRQVAAEFEGMLLTSVLKAGRAPLGGPGRGAGPTGGILRDLADEEMGRALARGRGLGLGEALYRDLRQWLDRTSSPDRIRPMEGTRMSRPTRQRGTP
jgi:Rod binding domain-containing protein